MTERERLHNAVANLGSDAHADVGRAASAVRQPLAEAEESLAAVATPRETGHFIKRCVGPIAQTPDGKVVRKDPESNTTPAQAETVKWPIAGVGFEPTTSGL